MKIDDVTNYDKILELMRAPPRGVDFRNPPPDSRDENSIMILLTPFAKTYAKFKCRHDHNNKDTGIDAHKAAIEERLFLMVRQTPLPEWIKNGNQMLTYLNGTAKHAVQDLYKSLDANSRTLFQNFDHNDKDARTAILGAAEQNYAQEPANILEEEQYYKNYRSLIANALPEIPEGQRNILNTELHRNEETTQTQAAKTLGISIGTYHSALSNGKKNLMNILNNNNNNKSGISRSAG